MAIVAGVRRWTHAGRRSRPARAARAGRAAPVRRLTGVDRMYLALESAETPMHFGAFVLLDGAALLDEAGNLPLALVRRRLAAAADGIPELRRVVRGAGAVAGGPIWVDDPAFRIERHVGEARLPPGPTDEAAILAFVERLMTPVLDRAHPLWRVWFLTGLPDGRVGLLVIVHHALTDGLGAMRVARSLLDGDPDRPLPSPATEPAPAPTWLRLVVDHLAGTARSLAGLASASTWHATADALWSFGTGWSAMRGEPHSSLNARVGPRRRLAAVRLDARMAKWIARADGVGVDDVVLGLVAGGLREMLAARGEPVAHMAPRVAIAVALPARGRDAASGNHFGGYVIPLPIAIDDPVARRRAIAVARAEAKVTQTATGVTAVRVWTSRFPPTRSLMGRQRVVNLMETFLPGPPRPVAVLGAPVLDILPIQPLGRNVGLTVIASTYAGRLTLVVRADPDAFPDLDTFESALVRGVQRG